MLLWLMSLQCHHWKLHTIRGRVKPNEEILINHPLRSISGERISKVMRYLFPLVLAFFFEARARTEVVDFPMCDLRVEGGTYILVPTRVFAGFKPNRESSVI